MKRINTKGFTIIELLISIVTFSLVLLIITGSIIQFTRVYYKGVITNQTQEVARRIADSVARSAQFSTVHEGAESDGTNYGKHCFGDTRYNFIISNPDHTNRLGDERERVLTVDKSNDCDSPSEGNDATELLGEHMQLVNFEVEEQGDGSTFEIRVRVAYGNDFDYGTGTCPAISVGGQFCAVSEITSTVTRRL